MFDWLLLPTLGVGLILWTRQKVGNDDELLVLYMTMRELGVGPNTALWYIYKHEIMPKLGESFRAIDVLGPPRWGHPTDDGLHRAN